MKEASPEKTLAMVQAYCPKDSWPFVEAFLCDPDLNVAKAERACGWPSGAGKRALADSRVRNTIGQILQDAQARHLNIRDKAIFTLAQIAFHDPAEAWNENNQLLHIRDMPEAMRMSITEYNETTKPNGEVVIKIKFADRVKVLDMVLKMFQAFDLAEGESVDEDKVHVTLRGVQNVIDVTPVEEGET